MAQRAHYRSLYRIGNASDFRFEKFISEITFGFYGCRFISANRFRIWTKQIERKNSRNAEASFIARTDECARGVDEKAS